MGREQQDPAHAGGQLPGSSCAPEIQRDHIPSDLMPCCIPHPPGSAARLSSAHSPPLKHMEGHNSLSPWLDARDFTPRGVCRGAGEGSLSQLPSPLTACSPENFLSCGSQEQFGFHTTEERAAPSTLAAPAGAEVSNCSFLKSICCFQRF